ncbi:hypothetical protein YPPY15_1547 [Yersinia pestis PY-15]|uniref:Uncharacterized protein n=2 Tax=Yersinia pestis TaxID=632 RepID=A0AAV3BH36_YERPE|nr:hypothetical protein YPIP275_4731 [Yersinia pestis biovar Orientalis str. IP275]EDR40818.1 hypothetical protein YpF1991016_0362 [Yersinia pestis biovar Orientalis str. F1991016]EFA46326.1 hypothetical protein YPD27_0518 [Yersinia pestis KIM D27]EIR21154.1 hypothetical protein YPPY08_1589 [Yersinia pestis PY-08]EIR49888.1 hypothetical protein YPPY15_1547 [Yersinia pestis PY-15]EIR67487.1 hypothetical protein YPPY25_1594 [Yersinia pestis PY-25]EIR80559.1 hypothetical protein YPPY32_1831 [Yer
MATKRKQHKFPCPVTDIDNRASKIMGLLLCQFYLFYLFYP